ncbi:hypothetical protein EVAR_62351_1 [Eumeta japonica]|uniref:N-acetyltransferase domain-containing protein n=1 Tax=Eumeta variegata TaxID=151549 RepID=A0A4C1ZPP3_EUMVA|nr:hypothetical protein EVAR_62351_1 [Eumeta japonica]
MEVGQIREPGSHCGRCGGRAAITTTARGPISTRALANFFEFLIDGGLTYGLFSSADGSPLAWICICDVGLLTHLYCEVPYRGRGYGEYITKYCINDQLKRGKDVFCCICEDNIASLRLFRKLGFDVVGRGVWTYVKREPLTIANGK